MFAVAFKCLHCSLLQDRLEQELASILSSAGLDIGRLAAKQILSEIAFLRKEVAYQKEEMEVMKQQLAQLIPH